jgi:hypothetical protein
MWSFTLLNNEKRRPRRRDQGHQRPGVYLVYSSEQLLQSKSKNERLSNNFLVDLHRHHDVGCIL